MNARGLFASVVAVVVTAGCAVGEGGADPGALRVERIESASDGTPYFVGGELGRIGLQGVAQLADPGGAAAALAGVLPGIAGTLGVAADDLAATRVDRDGLGMTHVRMAQRKSGLRVVGGDVVLHLGADGAVRAVSSTARDGALEARPAIDAAEARRAAMAAAEAAGEGAGEARGGELVYVVSTGDGELHLAWEIEVIGGVAPRGALVLDRIYVDALTGQIADRRPQVFTARRRAVYDGQNKTLQEITTTPPTLGTEASPPAEQIARAAFDNTGSTYDCYQALYQRDSYNATGGDLESIVHVRFQSGASTTGNNAAWIPLQDGTGIMVYGDGDGTVMGPTALGFDVTTHELTHGVTSATANLAYMNESGALNEGMSDIMAAVCEAWKDGAITADTWKVGEDIWTPRTAGDALRYMTNPTMDGSSKDYYPERYTGTQDNGGVHTNSGIPNLAFYLLVAGGKHPRARTAIDVPALGMERAGAIFQRALTQGYFTTTTNFAQARTATEQVAQELYPGCTKLAVAKAWAAVGIGAVPTDAAPPTTEITAPADGATVEAGFEVQVNATDDLCVAKVELSIDGAVVATSSAPPYTFPTDMGLAPGTHTIQVTTYDSAGQSTDSATVTVPDAGGCCSTGGRGATGSLALAVAVAFALRRRRGLS